MESFETICALTDCSYNIENGEASCGPGGDNCTSAYLQPAYESAFHTSPIRDETQIINERLHKLSKKPPRPGLQLSFLWTPRGVMLAWVEHKDNLQFNGVTRASGIAANDEALGLYPHEYHPGFEQSS